MLKEHLALILCILILMHFLSPSSAKNRMKAKRSGCDKAVTPLQNPSLHLQWQDLCVEMNLFSLIAPTIAM